MRDPQDLCQISVLKTTRDELRKLGGKGETFDAIITRLIVTYEKTEPSE